MNDDPAAPRGAPNPRARTVRTILVIMLIYMIVRDILVRRRNRLRTSSRRDIPVVLR